MGWLHVRRDQRTLARATARMAVFSRCRSAGGRDVQRGSISGGRGPTRHHRQTPRASRCRDKSRDSHEDPGGKSARGTIAIGIPDGTLALLHLYDFLVCRRARFPARVCGGDAHSSPWLISESQPWCCSISSVHGASTLLGSSKLTSNPAASHIAASESGVCGVFALRRSSLVK